MRQRVSACDSLLLFADDGRECQHREMRRSAPDPFTQRMILRAQSLKNSSRSSSNDGEPRWRSRMSSKESGFQLSSDETSKTTASDRRLVALNPNMNEESLKVVETYLDAALANEHADISDEEFMKSAGEIVSSTPRKLDSIERKNGNSFYTVGSYRALTQRQNKKRRPVVPSEFFKREEEYYTQEDKERDIDWLQKEGEKQKMILHQITKALIYCCASNSSVSPVRVECERILLLASRTYTEVTKKLEHLRNSVLDSRLSCTDAGTITISTLTLTFNRKALHNLSNENYMAWSLCVLSHEEQVTATSALCLEGNNTLIFPGKFVFKNLQKDFTVNIQVYSLMIKRNIQKQYLKRFLLLPRSRSQERMVGSQILSRQAIFKTSDFQLEGSFSVCLRDLQRNIIRNEFPFGSLQVSVKWCVQTKIQLAGFLTIQDSASKCPSWDRRWCVLEASELKFWNYPTCRDLNMPPLLTLDLHKCKTTHVQPLDRVFCPRPRTFLLEMIYGRTETEKYLLSADTSVEFDDWCSLLNKNLAILRMWKTLVKSSDL